MENDKVITEAQFTKIKTSKLTGLDCEYVIVVHKYLYSQKLLLIFTVKYLCNHLVPAYVTGILIWNIGIFSCIYFKQHTCIFNSIFM